MRRVNRPLPFEARVSRVLEADEHRMMDTILMLHRMPTGLAKAIGSNNTVSRKLPISTVRAG